MNQNRILVFFIVWAVSWIADGIFRVVIKDKDVKLKRKLELYSKIASNFLFCYMSLFWIWQGLLTNSESMNIAIPAFIVLTVIDIFFYRYLSKHDVP